MRSNAEWQEWGRRDPLWGVASWRGREKGGANPWTDEEFYALGRDWERLAPSWIRAGGQTTGTVLEIGCGAGRMTRMLARAFDRVIAVDVSAEIIAYARHRVTDAKIDWRHGSGDRLPADVATVDAVFSCHVFQHFPDTQAQLAMFAEIRRALKPGGTFFVHLPVHSFPQGRFGAIARGAYARSSPPAGRARVFSAKGDALRRETADARRLL